MVICLTIVLVAVLLITRTHKRILPHLHMRMRGQNARCVHVHACTPSYGGVDAGVRIARPPAPGAQSMVATVVAPSPRPPAPGAQSMSREERQLQQTNVFKPKIAGQVMTLRVDLQ